MLSRFSAVLPIRCRLPRCFLPTGSQYSGYLRCTWLFAGQSEGKVRIKAQAGLPEIDVEEFHYEVNDRRSRAAAEAMPAALFPIVDLKAPVVVAGMERTLNIAHAVRVEAVKFNDLPHGETFLDLGCEIRTAARHRLRYPRNRMRSR